MACDLTLGRLHKCSDQHGGVKNVYFINNVVGTGLLDSATIAATDQITAFASALTLFKYEVRGAFHTFNEEGSDPSSGSVMYTQTLNVVLNTQSLADRKELKILVWGNPHIVVEDYNGNYKLMGIENGADVQLTLNSGSELSDPTGYTINAVAKERDPANFILASIIDDSGVNTTVTVGT